MVLVLSKTAISALPLMVFKSRFALSPPVQKPHGCYCSSLNNILTWARHWSFYPKSTFTPGVPIITRKYTIRLHSPQEWLSHAAARYQILRSIHPLELCAKEKSQPSSAGSWSPSCTFNGPERNWLFWISFWAVILKDDLDVALGDAC